jgi:hypothetical protein
MISPTNKQNSNKKSASKAVSSYYQSKQPKNNTNRLNKAIYETLIINKTSMLKKTITEMNQTHDTQKVNYTKRSDSKSNIPRP